MWTYNTWFGLDTFEWMQIKILLVVNTLVLCSKTLIIMRKGSEELEGHWLPESEAPYILVLKLESSQLIYS